MTVGSGAPEMLNVAKRKVSPASFDLRDSGFTGDRAVDVGQDDAVRRREVIGQPVAAGSDIHVHAQFGDEADRSVLLRTCWRREQGASLSVYRGDATDFTHALMMSTGSGNT